MSRHRITSSAATFITGLLLGAGGSYLFDQDHPELRSVSPQVFGGRTACKVVRVVDGDTVVLLENGKEVKVRLIGVDTPETVKPNTEVQPYGPEASRFTKNLLMGEEVFIEHDPTGAGEKDRYNRELAFLYRAPDGLFVNRELVRQGYAKVYRKVDFKYRSDFEEVEEAARREGKGLWGVKAGE